MPRPHPRLRVLLVLMRAADSMPASSIALEAGIEPAEAVGHLRQLRARSEAIRLPAARGRRAEWVAADMQELGAGDDDR